MAEKTTQGSAPVAAAPVPLGFASVWTAAPKIKDVK